MPDTESSNSAKVDQKSVELNELVMTLADNVGDVCGARGWWYAMPWNSRRGPDREPGCNFNCCSELLIGTGWQLRPGWLSSNDFWKLLFTNLRSRYTSPPGQLQARLPSRGPTPGIWLVSPCGGGWMRASLVYDMRLFSCKISCGSQSDYSRTGSLVGTSGQATENTSDKVNQMSSSP